MECNREEAFRAKEIAEKKMETGDFVGAQKLLMKAQRLFPNLDNLTQLTAVCEVHCSAQNKINGLDNWYGILQVEQSADEATIKKQYRKLALLLHPDKNKFGGAEAAFKLVGEANRLLTDRAKRSLYDVRCRAASRGFVSKPVPSQSNTNAGKQYGPAKNVTNFASNQKASHLAFWTCCQFCGMRYKYLREYVNRILRCQTCSKSFIAYDVGFEGVPPASNPGPFFVRKEVSSQWSSRAPKQSSSVKPAGVEHVDKSTGLGQASKPVAKAEVGKTATREEKNSEKDIGGGKNDVEMPKPDTSKPQPAVTKPEVNKAEPCAAKSQFEVTKPEARPSMAKSESPVTKCKPDVEKGPSKSRERNKKRKAVEESSESFDPSNCDDGKKDDVVQQNGSNISGQNSEGKRRSSRKKRQVSYVETGTGNDFVSPPSKKSKACRMSNSDGEMREADAAGGLSGTTKSGGSAACADTCEKEVDENKNFTFEESSLNKDSRGEGYKTNGKGVISGQTKDTSNIHNFPESNDNATSEPKFLTIPDAEFSDFDKDKTVDCFAVHQVWAVYDPADGMPRFYARVRKVFSSEFKIKITWLEPRLADQEEQNEIEEDDMPVACGKFQNGETQVTEDLLMFSHQMHSSTSNSVILIYPKKGETWAIFRDWDISWKTDQEKRKPPYRYDFVEILTDYSDNIGIGVCFLGKVKGFVSVFKQAEQHGVIAFQIPPAEIYRFSHKVPSFPMTGKEKEGVPAGSVELDPAALPSNTFELGRASDVKLEKQSVDGKVDGSCPKAPETESEAMTGTGSIPTPKKRHKTDKCEEELSNGICKNLDQCHKNQCLNEEDKGVSSKGNSTSCQDHEMKSVKKPEKGNRTTETLKLRRSPRGLSENIGQANANRSTAQEINKLNNFENHDVPTQSDDKMNTPKKLEKDDSVTESSRLRSSVRVLNQKDGQLNGNNNDFSSQSNGSHGVMKDSKCETFASSTHRTGEENSFDFMEEKSEEKFQIHQIWALYSTNDSMPKEYVQIKKIETTPTFRLHVVLLESCSLPKNTTLSVCCGLFKVKNGKTKALPRTNFSHKLQAIKVDKNKYEVFPRKGEIWAFYKNGNSGQCDIVEVLEDNGEIIKFAGLKCVDPSKSLYRVMRGQGSMAGMIEVPRADVARFSHQIPAFQHTGKKNRLRGCWKLDPSAIPDLTIILD